MEGEADNDMTWDRDGRQHETGQGDDRRQWTGRGDF